MTASVLQLLARQVRRSIRPFTFTKDGAKPVMKPLYDIATWVASMGTLNMLVPCFDLLHIGKIMHVWRQVYYCHFIAIAVFSLLFYTLIKPNCRHHTSGDKKKN